MYILQSFLYFGEFLKLQKHSVEHKVGFKESDWNINLI